ncbi:MAG: hydrogen gas-evolving membrane-bound hydrogenase subunit E [Nocardioidaceae bacterium]
MRRLRLVLCLVGTAGLVAMFTIAIVGLPSFGSLSHPYGSRAVAAAIKHGTTNVVASVTFDQRGIDTMGEEFILFAAALGTLILLRRMRAEAEDEGHQLARRPEDVFEAARLVGLVMLPVTLLIGGYIVLHGHLTPGGGFQGGVVLATGLHVAFLAGDLGVLERLRPVWLFDITEATGAGAFVVVGLVAMASGSAFLTNVPPFRKVGDVVSAGTIPLLNIAVGIEVASAIVLLLSKFLEQALLIHPDDGKR